MIERLLIALRALADFPKDGAAQARETARNASEIALDFDDAYLLLSQCQQLELSTAQRDAVATVDRLLDRLRTNDGSSQTGDAARRLPAWREVRVAARVALEKLGYGDPS